MTVKELLEHAEKFEVDTYKLSRNFRETHISFTGAPEKHPYADDKIILISIHSVRIYPIMNLPPPISQGWKSCPIWLPWRGRL